MEGFEMATELPRTWRTPEGEDRIEIDGNAWGPGDIARDAQGGIFKLIQYRSGEWHWCCFDSEFNWRVGDSDGPRHPVTKMRLVEA
jgi:hypothetical protein